MPDKFAIFGVDGKSISVADWQMVSPVLEIWSSVEASDFPNYSSGSWGPESAGALIAQDGRSWL